MRKFRLLVILFGLGLCTFFASSLAQDTEKSAFISFVEDKLSSPNRQIRLNGIEGTLSSDVRLTSITISDTAGVWLTIVNPRLVWNRGALLLGRVEIESLTAERIEFPRKPQPDENLPSPEATSFALPDLPVGIVLNNLSVPEVSFGPEIFGAATRISAARAPRTCSRPSLWKSSTRVPSEC